MPNYLVQVSYRQEGWKALVSNPQNRVDALRPVVERLGGKVQGAWFAFGDYDIVLILEVGDNVSAAALAMAAAAGGSVQSIKTTPLLSLAEAVEAMKKAGTSGYRAVSASS